MDEAIKSLSEFVKSVDMAVWSGFEAYAKVLPDMVKSHLTALAKTENLRLNSTLEEYLKSVSVEIKDDGLIVVEMDGDSWLANALEGGAKGFDMRAGLLKNPDWTDKQGYRYKIIPLKPKKKFDNEGNASTGREELSDTSHRVQGKINEFLDGKNWTETASFEFQKPDPSKLYKVTGKATNDKDVKGIFRVQEFSKAGQKRPSKTTYMMFRTVTDKPSKDGKVKWQHPGIEARNYFPKLKSWFDGPEGDRSLTDALDAALDRAFR